MKDLLALQNLQERIEWFASEIGRSLPVSKEDLKSTVHSFIGKAKAIFKYQSKSIFQGHSVLVKPTESTVQMEEEDYGWGKVSSRILT